MIRKNSLLLIYGGELISNKQADAREQNYKEKVIAGIFFTCITMVAVISLKLFELNSNEKKKICSINENGLILRFIPQGLKNYLFRLDKNRVIDATIKGNAARFINHSCSPNCKTEKIEIDGKWQIVIFSIKKIEKGEEVSCFSNIKFLFGFVI